MKYSGVQIVLRLVSYSGVQFVLPLEQRPRQGCPFGTWSAMFLLGPGPTNKGNAHDKTSMEAFPAHSVKGNPIPVVAFTLNHMLVYMFCGAWYRDLINRFAPQTAELYVGHSLFPFFRLQCPKEAVNYLCQEAYTVPLLFIIVGCLAHTRVFYQVAGIIQMISWSAQMLCLLALFQTSHILHHWGCSCWVQLHTFSVSF